MEPVQLFMKARVASESLMPELPGATYTLLHPWFALCTAKGCRKLMALMQLQMSCDDAACVKSVDRLCCSGRVTLCNSESLNVRD